MRFLTLFLLATSWLAATQRGAFACPQESDTYTFQELPITSYDRDHWAFKPIECPNIPSTSSPVDNPIDAFIHQKLEEKNLTFAPQADKRTLLRRLSFDLIGLPPTAEELATFIADTSPLAFEKQVDRLLSSPLHGERAALFWLDLARFAETDGFEHDLVRKDAWQYRDWVIAAFNRDIGYDRFTREQLAGDEGADPAEKIATAFCLAGPDMPDLNDQHLRRHDRLNELTSTVGSVFLGLQMGCAQCHDHKYDPLSQADFYRLRAFFEPAIPELKRDKPYNHFATINTKAEPRFWIRGEANRPGPTLVAAFPRIADAPNQPESGKDGNVPTRTDFANWLMSPSNPLFARVAVNRIWQQHFGKGIFSTPSDAGLVGIAPSHEELLNWLAIEFREANWSIKSLRRKIVLSQTYQQASNNWGGSTKNDDCRPTEAHSGAQTDSQWQSRLKLDPQNDLYSRYPRRRLEGEALRDAMLFTAGELRFERGGPGFLPPLPPELLTTILKGQWTETKDKSQHTRRSIYLFARRNLRYPLFEAFDRPDANASCPIRNRSTTPSQAFVLLHGELPLQMAKALATSIVSEFPTHEKSSTAKRLERLFQATLNRLPSESEKDLANTFFADQSKHLANEHPDWSEEKIEVSTLSDAALALFNSSEFLYIE